MAVFVDSVCANLNLRKRSRRSSAPPFRREKQQNEQIKSLRIREITTLPEIVLGEPPKTPLIGKIKNMIENDERTDCVVCIEQEYFYCHMNVLQSYSEVFQDLSTELFVRLPPQKVSRKAFHMIYNWMKADHPKVQRKGILELFEAAAFLRMRSLLRQIWTCFDNDRCLVEASAFMLFLEAKTLPKTENMNIIRRLMLGRVYKFYQILMTAKEFLDLEIEHVSYLLSSNRIGVHSEIEIFLAAVHWLHHHKVHESSQVNEVMDSVRFNILPPWFLVLLNNNKCKIIRPFTVYPDVIKKIKNGLIYHTTQLYYGENREEYLTLLERYGLVVPLPRCLLTQPDGCLYSIFEESIMHELSFELYLAYLQKIQTIATQYIDTLTFANDGKDLFKGRQHFF